MVDSEPIIQSVLIGFGHQARTGKDTAIAEIIKERSETYDIRKYGFGDAVKQEVNRMVESCGGMKGFFQIMKGEAEQFNYYVPAFYDENSGKPTYLPEWVVYDPDAPMDDPLCPLGKQRTLLQFWGEYRRKQDMDYWVNKLIPRIAEDKPDIALICDLRYPNEFNWIKDHGETIKVIRPDKPNVNPHISEQALSHVPNSEWSFVLENKGSLAQFHKDAVAAFDFIMENMP